MSYEAMILTFTICIWINTIVLLYKIYCLSQNIIENWESYKKLIK